MPEKVLDIPLVTLPGETCDLDAVPEPPPPLALLRRQSIPPAYFQMGYRELDERTTRAKVALGKRVVILGHNYQRDEIIKHADFRGDSYKLARLAAQQTEAEYIVFCGVHFMAETADILSQGRQTVILPNMDAGCHMAEMAPTQDVLDCWDELTEVVSAERIVPVTYVNSTAAVKALCGEHGGIVCTSTNAPAAFLWARQRAEKVLFFPDRYLGMNTARKLGWDTSTAVIWDPAKPLGGSTPEALEAATLIPWRGWCSVHLRFTVEQIKKARATYPDVKVIVHPECVEEVVDSADYVGSTEYIIRTVEAAPAGTVWAVGTEINLVNRLAKEQGDKTVFCLDPIVCPCSTMYRIHPAYLAWVMEALVQGVVWNQVKVDERTAHYARIALERMLEVR